MNKFCLFVIVLGLGAPMVSLRVFVQEKVTVRKPLNTPQTCQAHLTISNYLAPVFQNLYPVDKAIQSWFTIYLVTFIRCQQILSYWFTWWKALLRFWTTWVRFRKSPGNYLNCSVLSVFNVLNNINDHLSRLLSKIYLSAVRLFMTTFSWF